MAISMFKASAPILVQQARQAPIKKGLKARNRSASNSSFFTKQSQLSLASH